MKASFFSDSVPNIFYVVNSLSKKCLIQLSIKRNGKQFLFHTDFENSISLCKLVLSVHMSGKIRENMEKYGPQKSLYLDIFRAVMD